MAASATCCTRWMWLAKHVTTKPTTGRARKTRRSVAPTVDSEAVNPGSSALVESDSNKRTPGPAPSAPMRARSVRRPSTGWRSSLKSPEWSTTPWGVWKAVAKALGTEWVTGMNSTSHGPIRRRSPSTTGMKVAALSSPASSTRFRANPSVSSEP